MKYMYVWILGFIMNCGGAFLLNNQLDNSLLIISIAMLIWFSGFLIGICTEKFENK